MKNLEFISSEITNIITLKQQIESNITQIVKFYGLSLSAFFAFIVFYKGQSSEVRHLYAYLGICFIFFTSTTTYYTAHTISKNLKRRILYRREIVSLRNIANEEMNCIYNNNIICQLNASLMGFSKFDSLPTIAIIIGTTIPILFYIFLNDILISYEVIDMLKLNISNSVLSLSLSMFISLFALLIMLNLYTHHRREMIIASYVTINQSEKKMKDRIGNINDYRRRKKNYKFLKNMLILIVSVVIGIMYLQLFTNFFMPIKYFIILIFILVIFIVILLVKKNRVLNMRKLKIGKGDTTKPEH